MTSASSDDLSATGHSASEHAFLLLLEVVVKGGADDDMASDFEVVLSCVTVYIGYKNTLWNTYTLETGYKVTSYEVKYTRQNI